MGVPGVPRPVVRRPVVRGARRLRDVGHPGGGHETRRRSRRSARPAGGCSFGADPAAVAAPPVPEPLKPYRGLFVLDASQGIAGPYCATLLAACGASVVKVEPPAGDWSRGLSTREGTQSAMHVVFNRGKRSVVLDLQTE